MFILTNDQFSAWPDLFRVHVELLPPHGNLFVSLRGFAALKENIHQVTAQGVVSSPGCCGCSVGQFAKDCDVA